MISFRFGFKRTCFDLVNIQQTDRDIKLFTFIIRAAFSAAEIKLILIPKFKVIPIKGDSIPL